MSSVSCTPTPGKPGTFLSLKGVRVTSIKGAWCLGGSQQCPRSPPSATVLISALALNLFPFWAVWAKAHALKRGRWWQNGPSGLGEWDVACSYGAMMGSSEDNAAGWGSSGPLMGPGRGKSGPGLGTPGPRSWGRGSWCSLSPTHCPLGLAKGREAAKSQALAFVRGKGNWPDGSPQGVG